jgi:hypothetical protein
MNDESRRVSIAATLGFMVGLGAMALFAHSGHWRHRRPDPEKMLRRFTADFSLTADQQKTFKTILDDNAVKLDALHKETDGKLAEIRSSMRSEMRAALDPDQVKKFDEKAAKWDAKRKAAADLK